MFQHLDIGNTGDEDKTVLPAFTADLLPPDDIAGNDQDKNQQSVSSIIYTFLAYILC